MPSETRVRFAAISAPRNGFRVVVKLIISATYADFLTIEVSQHRQKLWAGFRCSLGYREHCLNTVKRSPDAQNENWVNSIARKRSTKTLCSLLSIDSRFPKLDVPFVSKISSREQPALHGGSTGEFAAHGFQLSRDPEYGRGEGTLAAAASCQ